MLSVLLKILAVLGIVLLILLGIMLFLLLIVLFVPITYRVTGQIDQAGKEAVVKVNWLFGLLRFQLRYSEKLSWKLQLLWFDLKEMFNKKSDATASDTEPENQKTPETQKTPENQKTSETPKASEIPEQEQTKMEQPGSEAVPAKESESQKVQVISKIKDIWNNISYYLGILQEDDTKHLISHCLNVIGNILKSIRPQKIKLDVVIGFDSPDTTGKIYGLLCMLYPYYGDDIHITPDFENKILEGSVFVKGRIYICVLIWNALCILFDRKLFKVIHKLKNGGKGKNGR